MIPRYIEIKIRFYKAFRERLNSVFILLLDIEQNCWRLVGFCKDWLG
jgi:hypothetical protein